MPLKFNKLPVQNIAYGSHPGRVPYADKLLVDLPKASAPLPVRSV